MKWILLMILSALFWAGAFIAGKLGIKTATPLDLTYFRFFIACILLWIYANNRGIKIKITKKDWLAMIPLGLIGMIGYHLLFFEALKHTTAIKTSMIAATNPLMTAIMAALFLKERLTPTRIALVFTALTGVMLTITNWQILKVFNGAITFGDIIMFGAVFCWAIYSIMVKKLSNRFDPVVTTFYSFFVCVIILTPFEIYEVAANGIAIDSTGWLAILYMAIFPTCIGYLVQQHAIKHIGVSKTALFVNLVPIFVMVMAIAVLGEKFFWLNVISALIIICSVIAFTLIPTKKAIK